MLGTLNYDRERGYLEADNIYSRNRLKYYKNSIELSKKFMSELFNKYRTPEDIIWIIMNFIGDFYFEELNESYDKRFLNENNSFSKELNTKILDFSGPFNIMQNNNIEKSSSYEILVNSTEIDFCSRYHVIKN